MAGKRISLTLVLVILAGILLIMGAFRTVRAASEIPENGWLGPENPISLIQTPIDADRYHPAVAYNSNHHQYLVVWHNQWPGSKDIYGQRLDSLGRLLGPWFSISSGPNDRLDPAVAYNAIDDE